MTEANCDMGRIESIFRNSFENSTVHVNRNEDEVVLTKNLEGEQFSTITAEFVKHTNDDQEYIKLTLYADDVACPIQDIMEQESLHNCITLFTHLDTVSYVHNNDTDEFIVLYALFDINGTKYAMTISDDENIVYNPISEMIHAPPTFPQLSMSEKPSGLKGIFYTSSNEYDEVVYEEYVYENGIVEVRSLIGPETDLSTPYIEREKEVQTTKFVTDDACEIYTVNLVKTTPDSDSLDRDIIYLSDDIKTTVVSENI